MNEVNKFTKKSSISVLTQFVCSNMQENLSSVVPTRSDKNQAAKPLKFNSLTSCVNLLISNYPLLIANFINA